MRAVPVFRFRVTYAKEGPLRFISHRSLIQVILRSFRRAGLPFTYTQGFSPRPKVSYAPPLPLGVEGRAELVDVDLTRHQDPDDFLIQASLAVPSGLRFVRAENLLAGAPSLSHFIARARYVFRPLPDTTGSEPLGTPRCRELTAQTSIVVERTKKKDGSTKHVDVRPLIHVLEPLASGGALAEVTAAPQTVPPLELAKLLWPNVEEAPLERLAVIREGFIGHRGQELFPRER